MSVRLTKHCSCQITRDREIRFSNQRLWRSGHCPHSAQMSPLWIGIIEDTHAPVSKMFTAACRGSVLWLSHARCFQMESAVCLVITIFGKDRELWEQNTQSCKVACLPNCGIYCSYTACRRRVQGKIFSSKLFMHHKCFPQKRNNTVFHRGNRPQQSRNTKNLERLSILGDNRTNEIEKQRSGTILCEAR